MPGADTITAAVVDASVAVKWVVDEPSSDAAAALLERPIAWMAPRLMLVARSRDVPVLGVGAASA